MHKLTRKMHQTLKVVNRGDNQKRTFDLLHSAIRKAQATNKKVKETLRKKRGLNNSLLKNQGLSAEEVPLGVEAEVWETRFR